MSETLLASAGDDIKLWECAGFTQRRQLAPHSSTISSLDWSHDNNVLASASNSGDQIVLTYLNAAAYSYSLASGEGKCCLSFNLSSRYLVGGGTDNTVSVWDLKTQKLKRAYKGHQSRINSVAFNWNDTVVASGSENGEIIFHNVVTGVGSSPLIAAKGQAVRKVHYSYFKKSLLGSVSDDGAVNLWDANTRRLIHGFTESHKAPAMDLAFSPLNEMLLLSVGLDKRIVCYDVQGKNLVKTMMAEAPLTSISIMHNGTTLAVGSTRGKIYIYDLRQGATPIRTMTAHRSSVQHLQFQQSIKPTKSTGPSHPKAATPSNNRKSGTSSNVSNNNSSNINNKNLNRNGVGDTQTSPAIGNNRESQDRPGRTAITEPSRVREAELDDKGDIFSPLREPVTPQMSRSGEVTTDSRPETSGRHSAVDAVTYSDGLFSPLAVNFQNSSSERGQPVGGVMPAVSPLTYTHSISPAHLTDANQNRSNKEDYQDYHDYRGHNGSPQSGSTTPSSMTSSRDDISAEHSHLSTSRPQRMLPEVPASDISEHPRRPPSDNVDNGDFSHSAGDYSRQPAQSPKEYSQQSAQSPNEYSRQTAKSPNEYKHSRGMSPYTVSFGMERDTATFKESSQLQPTHHEAPQVTVTSPSLPSTSHHSEAATSATSVNSSPEGAVALPSTGQSGVMKFQGFSEQVIRNLVTDELREYHELTKQDLRNLHMDILKELHLQQIQIQEMLQKFSLNEDLVAELARVKEENRQLRKKF